MKLLKLLAIAGILVLAPLLAFTLVRALSGPAHERYIRPTIIVETNYPGANARVLADTVAAPIEQEVIGVEGMWSMRSHCSNDGKYTLVVAFSPGTDLNIAQVLIQNRVSIAVAVLPASVNQIGVTVRKKSPIVRAFLVLTSPDNSYDEIYLSSYATFNLHDELGRAPGVGDVEMLGMHQYGLQIWLDAQRLAARALSAADVVRVLQQQNLQPAAGPFGPGQAFRIDALGRRQTPEEIGNIVVKEGADGQKIFLRDVARVEMGAASEAGSVRFDGKRAIALAIHPPAPNTDAKALVDSIRKTVEELRGRLPQGLALDIAFEFMPKIRPDVLLVDLQLPDGASAVRIETVLQKCEAIARSVPGVTRTMTSLEDPFAVSRQRPSMLVGIDPEQHGGREAIALDLRTRLGKEISDAVVRINDLASSGRASPGGYPISFALCDTANLGYDVLAQVAERIAQRLSETGKVTDVGTTPPGASTPQLYIDIDREKARQVGVAIADIQTTLDTFLGGVHIGSSDQFGHSWQITVRSAPEFRDAGALSRLKVPNAQGQMVPLSAVAAIREESGPTAVERLNMYHAFEINCNPAPGVSLVQARGLCERIAEREMPASFKMTWLSAPVK
jgi:multidrug efflux pump subunit AcrB